MKKSYGKPLVYCENFITGEVLTNSVEYAQVMQEKKEKIKNMIHFSREDETKMNQQKEDI